MTGITGIRSLLGRRYCPADYQGIHYFIMQHKLIFSFKMGYLINFLYLYK